MDPAKAIRKAMMVARSLKADGGFLDDPQDIPQRKLNPLGMYSGAAEAARNLPQQKGQFQQMMATLRKAKGVKPDEIAHSKIESKWSPTDVVTRDDLASHFESSIPNVYKKVLSSESDAGTPRFKDYSTKGGSNYRENLFKLPTEPEEKDNYFSPHWRDDPNVVLHSRMSDRPDVSYAKKRAPKFDIKTPVSILGEETPRMVPAWKTETDGLVVHKSVADPRSGTVVLTHAPSGTAIARYLDYQGAQDLAKRYGALPVDWTQSPDFIKSVFNNPENVYINYLRKEHLRNIEHEVKARKLGNAPTNVPEGARKALLLDELQSDWAQQKRSNNPNARANAPYVDSTQKWTDLGLKAALHEAATGGHSHLVWTPGEHHAKRYNIRKLVNELVLMPSRVDESTPEKPVYMLHAYGRRTPRSRSVGFSPIFSQKVTPEDLSGIVGKEIADRILKQPPNSLGHHVLSGENLEIGGEGMIGYYNNILPKRLMELAREHDPDAKISPYKTKDKNINGFPSLEITPKMRESIIKRGFKAFKEGGYIAKASGGPIVDPQKAIRKAMMVARSMKAGGGAPRDPHLSEIIQRGKPILPRTPDPSPEELATARADTRVGSDIVNDRLNKIVPESSRVVGGRYIPGAPGGGRWSDLPEHVLNSRGTGFNVQDHELHALWNQAVNESSQAAKNAVSEHNIVPTFGGKDWDKAMRLPLKDRLWYELSGEKMAENMPDLSAKEHMHFMDLVGATSARADPAENLERALAVLSQSLRGKPVDVDLTQPTAVRQALSRKGHDSSALPGNKTGHFSDTLALAGGVPTRFPISVNDVWVGRMFGVPDDVMSQNQSLHEPMALYFNKIRDLYNQRHGHETPFVHQSWNFQAPAWVHLRDPNAEVSSGDAYHQVWGGIIQKLKNAGVTGINDQKITREALMHPNFADALRKTTPGFRDAPKATIEFGTKLTPTGKRARELYDLAVKNGDKVSQREYLKAITSAMYQSSRGELHPWDRLKKAITGDLTKDSDITRIVSPTSQKPLDIGGTFEGDVSPNIRIPLKDMSDDQIAAFNALSGGPLRQAAMAVSKLHLAEPESAPREGHIRGHSLFIPTVEQIHPEEIKNFATALTQRGHDMSYNRHPNGYQFDVLPNFSGDMPVGIDAKTLGDVYEQTLRGKYPGAETIPHDFTSVYTPDSDYARIRSGLIKEIKDDFLRQAGLAGMESGEARKLLSASKSPDDVPAKGKRAWAAYRSRIDHLTEAEKQLKALAQRVEQNHAAFIPKAEKRMRLTQEQSLDQPFSVNEPHKSNGGLVDQALQLVAHLSRQPPGRRV